jgi:xanthosine utilization system XapX-like protein
MGRASGPAHLVEPCPPAWALLGLMILSLPQQTLTLISTIRASVQMQRRSESVKGDGHVVDTRKVLDFSSRLFLPFRQVTRP